MVDKNDFVEYLKSAKSGTGSPYSELTQRVYLACIDILRIPGMFESLYEYDEISDSLEKDILNNEKFMEYCIATNKAMNAAFQLYVLFLRTR